MLIFKLDEINPELTSVPVVAQRKPQRDAPTAPVPAPCGAPDTQEVPVVPEQAQSVPVSQNVGSSEQLPMECNSLEEWLAQAKRLARSEGYQGFAIGDHLNTGFRQFGQPALREARKLWTNSFVWQLRRVAERFQPVRRLENVRWHTYRKLFRFPDEIVDHLLPKAAAGVSANRLYAEACLLLSKDPVEHGKAKTIRIPASLHARLKAHTAGTVGKLVNDVLEGWLAKSRC